MNENGFLLIYNLALKMEAFGNDIHSNYF
uniref:Uncharacterized protein n=1 Tax=Lepeophtheirus salmonis TaxID=72036 RepID=A0A0K2T874_LEPSM